MKLPSKVASLFLCAVAAVTSIHAEALHPEVLTNDGILALANAGFSDTFIRQKIVLTSHTRFDVSVEGLSNLRQNALSESLILFLLEHTAKPSAPPSAAAPVAPATVAAAPACATSPTADLTYASPSHTSSTASTPWWR